MFPFAAAIPFVAPLVEKGIDALSGGSDDKSSDKSEGSDGGDGGFNPMSLFENMPFDLPFDLGGIFGGGGDDKGDEGGGGGFLGLF
jgi:hypothetical protein